MSQPPPTDPLDEAFAAYLRQCDSGELGSREEFMAQFPELSDQLKELIDAADMIGQMTLGGTRKRTDAEKPPMTAAVPLMQPVADPGAETIGANVASANAYADDSNVDPAITLPMPNRAKGDHGPTLPYDLGDYLLLQVIGRGGMGVVYLAKQSELDRHVAVKMIRSGILAGEDEVKRFYTEAQAAARLHHPGIVSVYQFGRRAGHHFFSMEHINGTDLQRKINGGVIEIETAARYVRDVSRAIHHAHEKGVLHRDLKPANVLIDEQDRVHVTDFGLAKHLDCDSSVTGSGDAVGTPHYMAPEQAGGHSDRASCESDVYALGAILFASLTGRPPIVGDTVMQTLVQVVHDPAPPVRSLRPDVPLDLQTIIAKCLEKHPGKRYRSAAELAEELNAFLDGRPIEARPRSRAMRAWHWFEGVPLVGAVTGRRTIHASSGHRRFQAAMLLLLLLTPLFTVGVLTWWQRQRDAMPAIVHIAGGLENGLYNDVSTTLADRVTDTYSIKSEIVSSQGSLDNRNRLISGQIDLAPMQATAISGDKLRVIAPLFYEVLYVLARADTSIQAITDLRGRSVAVDPDGSGSRATAELIFDSLQLDHETVERVVVDWERMFETDTPDAAMICIGRGSPLLRKLLATDRWRIIPVAHGIEISLQHPTLRPMTIETGEFPQYDLPSVGIPTVGTTSFLTGREDTPAELVIAMLDALYQEPPPFEGLIARRHAAEWQGLVFHRAARRYYADSQ